MRNTLIEIVSLWMYTCSELNGRSYLYAVSPELIDRSFLYQKKKKWRLPWVWSDLSKLNFVHNAQMATRLSDGLRPSKTKQKYMKYFLYSHSTFSQSNCSVLLSIFPEGTNELFSILFSSSVVWHHVRHDKWTPRLTDGSNID